MHYYHQFDITSNRHHSQSPHYRIRSPNIVADIEIGDFILVSALDHIGQVIDIVMKVQDLPEDEIEFDTCSCHESKQPPTVFCLVRLWSLITHIPAHDRPPALNNNHSYKLRAIKEVVETNCGLYIVPDKILDIAFVIHINDILSD